MSAHVECGGDRDDQSRHTFFFAKSPEAPRTAVGEHRKYDGKKECQYMVSASIGLTEL